LIASEIVSAYLYVPRRLFLNPLHILLVLIRVLSLLNRKSEQPKLIILWMVIMLLVFR
jgi:hypothetical protein